MASHKPFVIPFPKSVQKVPNDLPKVDIKQKKHRKFPKTTHAGKNKSFAKPSIKKEWWQDAVVDNLFTTLENEKPWFSYLPPQWNSSTRVDDQFFPNSADFAVISKVVEQEYNNEILKRTKNGNQKGSNNGDSWITDVIKAGTISDRVAALALKIQETSVFCLHILDELVALASKKDQRTSQMALEALKDLMINNLLPDRELKDFSKQPLLHPSMKMSTAILLWFEGQLKVRVERVVTALENALKSNVDYFKRSCLIIVMELLTSKPEDEKRLLSMLVNKLGDPKGNICSKSIEHLKSVIRVHPAMKLVVVREVRQFLYHPDMKLRPVYNGVIFLNQIPLNSRDHEVAVQLVQCFMSLFDRAIKEEELGSRLLSALLTGINRSIPFLDNIHDIAQHVDALFRVVYSSSFASSTQALVLLSQVVLFTGNQSSSHQKKQQNLKLEHVSDPSGVVDPTNASTVTSSSENLVRRFYRSLYAKLFSDQVATHSKNTALLNLLYRSIKADPDEKRAMAFIKRLSITAIQSSAPIAAALLFLVSEIVSHRPNMLTMLTEVEQQPGLSSELGALEHANHFEDNLMLDEMERIETEEMQYQIVKQQETQQDFLDSSSFHMIGNFNAAKREPEFAIDNNVSAPTLWEATLLNMHYHPSVQAFSQALLESESHKIEFSGDPTVEFNLVAFLNRFAYKNPKTSVSDKIRRSQPMVQEDPLNTNSFASASNMEIAPDKQFFHKFFQDREELRGQGRSRNRSRNKSGAGGSESDDDNDSDGSGVEFDGQDDGGGRDSDEDSDEDRGEQDSDDDDDDDDDDEEEEAAMDRFADRLAEKLMKDHEAQNFPDDDFSSDQGSANDLDDVKSDDDNGDIYGDKKIQNSNKKKGKPKSKSARTIEGALEFDDFVQSTKTSKKSSSKQVRTEDSSSDDGYNGLVAYEDDADDSNQFEEHNENDDAEQFVVDYRNSSKRKKKRGDDNDNDFASVDDYEAQMEEIVRAYQKGLPDTLSETQPEKKPSIKRKKEKQSVTNSKKLVQVSSLKKRKQK